MRDTIRSRDMTDAKHMMAVRKMHVILPAFTEQEKRCHLPLELKPVLALWDWLLLTVTCTDLTSDSGGLLVVGKVTKADIDIHVVAKDFVVVGTSLNVPDVACDGVDLSVGMRGAVRVRGEMVDLPIGPEGEAVLVFSVFGRTVLVETGSSCSKSLKIDAMEDSNSEVYLTRSGNTGIDGKILLRS